MCIISTQSSLKMYLHVNLCYQKHVILRNNIYSNATITKHCSQLFFSKVVISISEGTDTKKIQNLEIQILLVSG